MSAGEKKSCSSKTVLNDISLYTHNADGTVNVLCSHCGSVIVAGPPNFGAYIYKVLLHERDCKKSRG